MDVKEINKKLRILIVIILVIFVILVLHNADKLIHAVLPVSVAVTVVLVGLWKTRSNNHTKLHR